PGAPRGRRPRPRRPGPRPGAGAAALAGRAGHWAPDGGRRDGPAVPEQGRRAACALMRAAPAAPATSAEPGRHTRYSPPWRQAAPRPLTAALLAGRVPAMT